MIFITSHNNLCPPRRVAGFNNSFIEQVFYFGINKLPVFRAVLPRLGGYWVDVGCQVGKEIRRFNLQCGEATDYEGRLRTTMMEANTLMLLLKIKSEDQIRAQTRKDRQAKIEMSYHPVLGQQYSAQESWQRVWTEPWRYL